MPASDSRAVQRRLAIFDPTPFSYGGGYEQFAVKLQRAASESGWDAAVVSPSSSSFLKVVTLLGVRGRFSHLAANPAPAQNWEFLANATHAYVKNEHLDMLWWWAARGKGLRTIGFHTPLRYPAGSAARVLRNSLYANPVYGGMLRGSKLHLLNRYDYQALPRNARRLPAAIIPNGIEAQADGLHPIESFSALFVGRITPQKGLDRIASANVARHTGRITVLGEGPDMAQLRAKFGESATFLGTVSRAEALAQMQRHAILLMPSRWEGLPLTLLEAMSVGCVPVVSAIPTLADVLPAGLQWLAIDYESPQDVARVLDRLREMYGSPQTWQRLRDELANHVRANFDERIQLQKLLSFIETGNGSE